MSFGRRLVKARQQQPLEEEDDDATDINEEGPSGGQVIDDADSKLTYFPPGAWEPFSNLDSKVWKDGTVHGSSVVGAGVRFSLSGNALRVVGAITNEPTTLSLALSPVSSTSSPPRRFRYTSPVLEPGQNEFNHTFFLIDSLPTNEWTAELRWVEGSRVWLDWVEVIPGGPLTLPSTTTLTSTPSTSASATSTNAPAEPTNTGVAVGAVSANKIGAIAGGVTASIIFLLTLLFFLILCLRRRRRERDYKDNPRSYEEMAEAPVPTGPNEGGGGISVRMQLPGRVKVKKQVILQRDPSASSSGSGSTGSSSSSLVQAPVASTSLPNPHPPAVAASSAGAHEGSPSDTVLSSSLGTEPPLSPLPRYSNLGYGAGLHYSDDKKQRKSTLESHDETEETDAGIMLMYTPPSPPPMPSPSPPLRSASPETPLPSAIAQAPPPPRPPPRKVNFTATSTQAEGKKVRVLPQTPWNEPSLVAVSALTPRVRSPPAPPLAVHSAGKTPPFPVYSTRGPHAAMMSPPPPKLAKPKRYRLSLTGISSIHTSSPNVSPDDDDTSMAGVGTFSRGGSGKEVPERGHTEEVLRALNPPPPIRK